MKRVNGKSYLIIGLLLILVGIFTLIGSVKLFRNVANLTMILILLITIKDLFSLIVKKPKLDSKLFIRIFNVIIAIIALIFNEYSIAIIPIIFALYALLNASIYFVNFVIVKINNIKGEYKYFFCFIIYFIVGLLVLFKPIIHIGFMLNIIGIYSILLGTTFISDYLEINHMRKLPRIRISLPSIIEAIIPISTLQRINRTMNSDEMIEYDLNKKDIKPDLEILIHVNESGYGRLGHMDIYFDKEVISFGNYDISTYKFHDLIGTGVIFIVPSKRKYVKWCIEDNKKTLFSFGLKLNNEEKEKIRENILKIKSELKPWYCPYQQEKQKKFFVNKKKYNDYSSRLYRATKAKFYKFKKSKYKIFFALGNNCVSMANKIICKSLKDKFKFYGVLTPGTYYDYLEREYMKKNSIVVSKKIYSKNNIDRIT